MDIPLPHLYPPHSHSHSHSHPQHIPDDSIFHSQPHPHAPSLVSPLDLDPGDPFQLNTHLDTQLEPHHSLHTLQSRHAFDQRPLPRFHEIQSLLNSNTHDQNLYLRGAEYGVLSPLQQPPSQPPSQSLPRPETMGRPQNDTETRPAPVRNVGNTDGHFSNLKSIPNPPDLEQWRKKLFDVDELVTMTEDQYDRFTCSGEEVRGLKGRHCAGLRLTFPMWTTYTLTVQRRNISANPSCLIIGTVG